MTDLSKNSVNVQGKRAVCIYNYKATMNDELNLKIDDIVTITQCSEDETWLEGTLDGHTGWFPSNYVHILEENGDLNENDDEQQQYCANICHLNESEENTRIKYLNEMKRVEERFLDEMINFIKIVIQPLQLNTEIIPNSVSQTLCSSLDELIRLHQAFCEKLREIPDNSDAKVGNFLMKIAPQFKQVYEIYSRNNPKFANFIHSLNDQLTKFFESTLIKLTSPLLLQTSSPINVSIYITKFLAAPFKHIDLYVKILKEIHRYSEDYHVDRGDVQRCIEFYSELSQNIQEIRKKKEFELDIISSQINNVDQETFKSSEVIFLSSVLIINENGDKRDRILMLMTNCLVILIQNLTKNEFDFEYKIPFLNPINNSLFQIKRVTNLETLNAYGTNLISSLVNKYCFEFIGLTLQTSFVNNQNTNSIPVSRLLVSCSTQYDLRMWIDMVQNIQSSKRQPKGKNSASNIAASLKTASNNLLLSKQDSNLSLNKQLNNSNGKLNSSACTNGNGCGNVSIPGTRNASAKSYSFRPHPPLIPHFQLPNDLPQNTSLDGTSTLKRFMYKKPKLTEPFGKYHGADDDLKLLNVIETFCKTKPRQSINVHVHDVISSAVNKASIMPQQGSKAVEAQNDTNNIHKYVGRTTLAEPVVVASKNVDKQINKLVDEKKNLESNLQSVSAELKEYKHSNKELKLIISSLQKQLEGERNSRKKLENFVRKQLKTGNLTHNDMSQIDFNLGSNGNGHHGHGNGNGHAVTVEHESSI